MITATELRNNLYNKIDSVIATGIPIEIGRKGHVVQIISADHKAAAPAHKTEGQSKWSRLVAHPDCIIGDPDELENINWYDYGVFKL